MNQSIQLTADLQANYQRFVEHVLESGQVWSLKSDDGWVVIDSAEYEDSEVMPFWSDEAFAKIHCVDEWSHFQPTAISIEEFIEDWLSGMDEDGVLVGPNWNSELDGLEIEATDLLQRLSEEP